MNNCRTNPHISGHIRPILTTRVRPRNENIQPRDADAEAGLTLMTLIFQPRAVPTVRLAYGLLFKVAFQILSKMPSDFADTPLSFNKDKGFTAPALTELLSLLIPYGFTGRRGERGQQELCASGVGNSGAGLHLLGSLDLGLWTYWPFETGYFRTPIQPFKPQGRA